jgi:hypothetical protein
MARLRTASPIRVIGADLADLADLRLPAEAKHSSSNTTIRYSLIGNIAKS